MIPRKLTKIRKTREKVKKLCGIIPSIKNSYIIPHIIAEKLELENLKATKKNIAIIIIKYIHPIEKKELTNKHIIFSNTLNKYYNSIFYQPNEINYYSTFEYSFGEIIKIFNQTAKAQSNCFNAIRSYNLVNNIIRYLLK